VIPGDAPDDNVRSLIESVFGEDADIPAGLQKVADKAHGKDFGDASLGMHNVIKPDVGYEYGGSAWWGEAKTPSRLGEASVDVVLARWDGDTLQPWAGRREDRHAWAYSTVRVAARLISGTVNGQGLSPARQAERQRALADLPGGGKWGVLLALDETPDGWVGKAGFDPDGKGCFVSKGWVYDEALGLMMLSKMG
jgi:CRISPR-associated endonuclease/helicase Cas3